MSLLNVDKVDPNTGTTLTLGTSGDTVSIPSGVTLSGAGTITASAANLAASGAGGVTGTLPIANGGTGATTLAAAGLDNTPAFHARLTNTQSVSTGTFTKVELNQVDWQTGSTFDNTTNYRWTPGVAGKYFLYANMGSPGIDDNEDFMMIFKKNGSVAGGQVDWWSSGADHYIKGSTLTGVDSGASDYFEIFVYQASGDSQNLVKDEYNAFFGGFRIIGA
tara:strand:+ start:55 stop:714 length:660 start_codon:yes stop_codon:yes gene_type:complete